MESVSKAKQRFKNYPLIFGKCSKEAASYGSCVLKQDNLMKNDCAQEFQGFKNCLQQAAKNLKTKI